VAEWTGGGGRTKAPSSGTRGGVVGGRLGAGPSDERRLGRVPLGLLRRAGEELVEPPPLRRFVDRDDHPVRRKAPGAATDARDQVGGEPRLRWYPDVLGRGRLRRRQGRYGLS